MFDYMSNFLHFQRSTANIFHRNIFLYYYYYNSARRPGLVIVNKKKREITE